MAVYVSFHDNDWATGMRYVHALHWHGLYVVAREEPGSNRTIASDAFRLRWSPNVDVATCTGMVVILTAEWLSQKPPDPNFTRFQDISGVNSRLLTLVVSIAKLQVPPSLAKYLQIDAETIGFDAAVQRIKHYLDPSSDPISVFISYSHTEREFEKRLIQDLQDDDISVWVDHESLTPDTPDWEGAIRKAIARSSGVIYIASEDAANSQYVSHELAIARDHDIPVYSIWARGATWSSCVPFGWYRTQREDGRGDNYTIAVQSLISALKKTNGKS